MKLTPIFIVGTRLKTESGEELTWTPTEEGFYDNPDSAALTLLRKADHDLASRMEFAIICISGNGAEVIRGPIRFEAEAA